MVVSNHATCSPEHIHDFRRKLGLAGPFVESKGFRSVEEMKKEWGDETTIIHIYEKYRKEPCYGPT